MEASLRSAPTRNCKKQHLYRNLSVSLCVPTSKSVTHFRTLRARGPRESGFFFHESISFVEVVNKSLKSHFEVAYVVSATRFCARRARAHAKRDLFFMNKFLLSRRLTYFNDRKL